MTKTSAKYNYGSALLGLTSWGSWAYYVNSKDDQLSGIISGVTQGIASFIMTLAVVFVVTKIYNKIEGNTLKIILPAIITVSCMCISLVFIHTVIGTPHILKTIAPSLTVAFIFCLVTTYKLKKFEFS